MWTKSKNLEDGEREEIYGGAAKCARYLALFEFLLAEPMNSPFSSVTSSAFNLVAVYASGFIVLTHAENMEKDVASTNLLAGMRRLNSWPSLCSSTSIVYQSHMLYPTRRRHGGDTRLETGRGYCITVSVIEL